MKINVFDNQGKTKESIDFNVDKSVEKLDSNILTQYVRVFQTNQRQGTSKVKDKSEVSGGGKKPWKQKGTGRARAGSSRSPLWVGGGVTHGPTPKDWSIRSLKRIKKQAIQLAFVDKLNSDKAMVIELGEDFKVSTKNAAALLNSIKAEGKTLVVHANSQTLLKSFRNIPVVKVCSIDELSAYDVVAAENIVMDRGSFDTFNNKFFTSEQREEGSRAERGVKGA